MTRRRDEGAELAIYEDLHRGRGRDDVIAMIDRLMPDWLQADDPALEALALLMLDTHYGLHRDDDYVLVRPDYIWGLWNLRIVDRRIARVLQNVEGKPNLNEDREVAALVTEAPFTVRVVYEPHMRPGSVDPNGRGLPQAWRHRSFRVLVVPDEATDDFPVLSTRRADGSLITLP